MNEMMKSKGFAIAAVGMAFILVALVSFIGGVKVGSHRALFSARWGENYEKNFIGSHSPMDRMGPLGPMMRNFEGRDFRNAYGLSGAIISIADNKLIIRDRDGKENTVTVTDKTIIKNRANDLKISDLKSNDNVVVMGSPSNDGTVTADLIRVFDNLPPTNQNNNVPVENGNATALPGNNQPAQNNNQ